MNDFLMPSLVLLGLVVGVLLTWLLTWLLTRSRTQAQVEAAVAKADGVAQVELAQMRERIRSVEEARSVAQLDIGELEERLEATRKELGTAEEEVAKLSERASRVPTLESEKEALTADLRRSESDGKRLSNELFEKTEAERLLKARTAELAQEVAGLRTDLQGKTNALTDATKSSATFEEQAGRVPTLERQLTQTREQLDAVNAQLTELRESSGSEIGTLKAALSGEREAHGKVQAELTSTKSTLTTTQDELNILTEEFTELKTRADAEAKAAEDKLKMLLEAKEALSDQFRTLANDILDEKSKKFAEQNQTNLGQLLEPLRNQLTEFKGKVEEVYVNEGKDRSALSEQVKQLLSLNQALSDDAKNLTKALKGEAKTQGNWGELVLERVLEASGLRKGHEYVVQDSQTREDGTRAQPDVVINLPEERRLVIDAKVSLLAYEQHTSCETDDQRAIALRRHLESVRGHIKGLSEKKYQSLYGLQSLDFVLMFIPVEPAFMMAVTNDNQLYMDAWNRNVLLVSPSTLLFVVRTVAHLWRQEAQSRNAQDIAKRGAELYERLHDFVKDLEAVGTRLNQAKESYDSAHRRLSTGRGNVIRQAEMLRDLGVKPSKALAAPLVELAMEGDLDEPVAQLPAPAAEAEDASSAMAK